MALEKRWYQLTEMRVAVDDPEWPVSGYAAVFDSPSVDLGGFIEIVKPGAFTQTIREDDIRDLFNHDPNYVLGRNRAGTLQLEEDAKGLRISVKPPDTGWARDLMTSMQRGDIDQMSFQFEVLDDIWYQQEKQVYRDLRKVRLYDVSQVTFPAYPETSIQVSTRGVNLAELASAVQREQDPGWIEETIAKLNGREQADPTQEERGGAEEGGLQAQFERMRRRLEVARKR